MSSIKTYIDRQHNSAEIVCPGCHRITNVSAKAFGAKHRLKVKCTCENIFMVEVEFRDRTRKRVDLSGFYEVIKKTAGIDKDCAYIPWENSQFFNSAPNCLIIDLSVEGIGFIILDEQEVKVGDFVNLHIRLDDRTKSRISQTCRVKHINDNFVGCTILKENTSLGLYLLAKKSGPGE